MIYIPYIVTTIPKTSMIYLFCVMLILINGNIGINNRKVTSSTSSSSSSTSKSLIPPSLLPIPTSIKMKEKNMFVFNIILASSILISPNICHASKGAFEMDVDFYLRNIINGKNTKVENVKKVRKSLFPSPRKMNISITTKIINIIKSIICKKSNISIEKLDEYIAIELPKKLINFKEYIPITNEDFSDQYYFDIYLYLIYKGIENIVTKSEDRVILRQTVGDEILQLLKDEQIININEKNDTRNVVTLAANVKTILEYFQKIGIISSYNFDDDDLADQNYADLSFQEGLPVSFQFTLKEPATLIGFIEQNRADTFYHPEIIASTIASYCRLLKFNTRFEDYLVDNYYRTENFDIEAQDILIEMLIK